MAGGTLMVVMLSLASGQSAPPKETARPPPAASAEDVTRLRVQLDAQSQALEEAQARTSALEAAQAEAQAAQEALDASRDSRAQQLDGSTAALGSQALALIGRQNLDQTSLQEMEAQLSQAAAQAAREGSEQEAQSTATAHAQVQSAIRAWQDENGREVPIRLDQAARSLQASQRALSVERGAEP